MTNLPKLPESIEDKLRDKSDSIRYAGDGEKQQWILVNDALEILQEALEEEEKEDWKWKLKEFVINLRRNGIEDQRINACLDLALWDGKQLPREALKESAGGGEKCLVCKKPADAIADNYCQECWEEHCDSTWNQECAGAGGKTCKCKQCLESGEESPAKDKKFIATIGPAGSGAQYECDGTNDEVQVQAAIDAVHEGRLLEEWKEKIRNVFLEGDYDNPGTMYDPICAIIDKTLAAQESRHQKEVELMIKNIELRLEEEWIGLEKSGCISEDGFSVGVRIFQLLRGILKKYEL